MSEYLRCGGLDKFIVIKRDDLDLYISPYTQGRLNGILKAIEGSRQMNHRRTDNEYIVINTDEPYAEEITEILKRNGHWG